MRIEDVIALRIAEHRKASGRTQGQIGEDLGSALGKAWPRQAVSNAEKGGRAFGAADLIGLAVVLGTTVEALLQPPAGVSSIEIGDGVAVDVDDLRSLIVSGSDPEHLSGLSKISPRQRRQVIELVQAILETPEEPTGVRPGQAPADIAERGTVLGRSDDRSAGTA